MLTRGMQLGGGFQPAGDGGGGGPQLQVQAGTCIAVTYPVLNTVQISAQIACIQSPWVGNIDGAGYNPNNAGHIGIGAPSNAGYGIVIAPGTNSGILIATNGSTNFGVVHQESSPTARGGFMCLNDEGRVAGFIFGGSNFPIPLYQNNVVLVAPYDLVVETNTSGTAGQFIFTRTGRLGVGTTTPGYALEAAQGDVNITDPAFAGYAYRINGIPLAFANTDGTTINLSNISNVNGQPVVTGPAGTNGQVQWNNNGAFGATPSMTWNGSETLIVNYQLRATQGSTPSAGVWMAEGSLRGYVSGGTSPNFHELNIDGAPLLLCRRDLSNAMVGIGILDPKYKLDIDDAININQYTMGPSLGFSNSNVVGTDQRVALIYGLVDGTAPAGLFAFETRSNAGVMAERMRITSTGRVGIGTNTPAYLLDVGGQTRLLYAEPDAGAPSELASTILRVETSRWNPTASALQYGSAAMQVFRNQVAIPTELAIGYGSNTYWLQARTSANAGASLSLNPVGSGVVVGGAQENPWAKLMAIDLSNQAPDVNRSAPAVATFWGTWAELSVFCNGFSTQLQSRYTNPGDNPRVLPLAINPLGGNVGIGTATPTVALHVVGDVNVGKANNGTLTIASDIPYLVFEPTLGGNDYRIYRSFGNGFLEISGDGFIFRKGSGVFGVTNLPTTDAGIVPGQGGFWADPADGYRVKYVP